MARGLHDANKSFSVLFIAVKRGIKVRDLTVLHCIRGDVRSLRSVKGISWNRFRTEYVEIFCCAFESVADAFSKGQEDSIWCLPLSSVECNRSAHW